MRFLVTGGAGFIGAHLSAHLAKHKDSEVLAIDSLSDYYAIDLKNHRVERFLTANGVDFKVMDLAEREQVDSVVGHFAPDYIYHLGAQAGIRLPIEKHHVYTNSNILGFSNILNAAARYQVTNFLYASSSSVYGDLSKIPLSESETNLRPTSFYGATKLCNEILASTVAAKSAMRIRGLRFFTVYGPWGRPDMAYFRVIESLLNGRSFRLFGDGSIKRDFTFIDDVVRSCELLGAELSGRPAGFHDIVNVGGGDPHSISEMIFELEGLSKQNLKVELHPSNSSDVRITHSDSTLLESLIGKHEFLKLDHGMQKFLSWAQEENIRSQLGGWVDSTI